MNSWEELFAKIQYKPNFEITYSNTSHFDHDSITIKMWVPDSRDPNNHVPTTHSARKVPLIPVTATFVLEQWHGEQYAKGWLRSVLRQLEDHELDEWLRCDGVLMNDPHADQAAYDRAG